MFNNMFSVKEKKCSKCGVVKPLTEYYKRKSRKIGVMPACKKCMKSYRYSGEVPVENKCTGCLVTKPLAEFHKSKTGKYGRNPRCKKCRSEIQYAPTDLKEKECCTCGELKDLSEFHKDKARKSGTVSKCKECASIYKRNNKDIINRSNRKHYRNPENKRKQKAQSAVRLAIGRGLLPSVKTLLCAHCENKSVDYHHWSYKKENWLDVIPLCRACHMLEHKRLKKEGIEL